MPGMVCMGAEMRCSFGAAPCRLVLPPGSSTVFSGVTMAATVKNIGPANIPTFGTCSSPTHPAVMGGAPSGPCKPVITGSWLPPPAPVATVMIGDAVALHEGSVCLCQFGGQISITNGNSIGTEVN